MKKILFSAAIIFLTIGVKAQLANTKWQTTLQLDEAVDVVFNFGTDTLSVFNPDDNSTLETMNYTMQDSILIIRKLNGQSECDTSAVGKYNLAINGDEMWLKLISDDCSDRSNIIKDIKLNKTE